MRAGTSAGQERPGAFRHGGRVFLPIDPNSLGRCKLPTALYLRHADSTSPVLYRAAGIEFTPESAARLAESGITTVFVPSDQHDEYRAAVRARLAHIRREGGESAEDRVSQTRALCAALVEDVLCSPGQPEAVEAVAEASRELAEWAVSEPDSFAFLMQMSAHDFHTATHMVNVAVGCGLLFRELRRDDRAALPDVLRGGLLHDIGKRGVPQNILTKVGELTPKEWQILRRHPRLAFEELRRHPAIPAVVLEMARDHHERLDGGGYPNEVGGEKIGLAARVCTVVDVYDALTSLRPYRRPLSPGQALTLMDEGAGTHFDAGVLATWGRVVRRLEAGQGGGAEAEAVPQRLTLASFLPHLELDAVEGNEGSRTPRDRRAHPRIKCAAVIQARFVTQGRACGVPVGELFPALAEDISRAGMQISVPYPVSLGDLLEVHITRSDGTRSVRAARVVRIAVASPERFFAGLKFEEAEPQSKAAA